MAKITVIGHLGRDAKVIEGSKGKFANLTICDATEKDNAVWYAGVLNNPQHITLAEKGYLNKGRMLEITGTYRERLYTDQNGETKLSRDIYVDYIIFPPVSRSGATESDADELETLAKKAMTESLKGKEESTSKPAPAPSKPATKPEPEDDGLPF